MTTRRYGIMWGNSSGVVFVILLAGIALLLLHPATREPFLNMLSMLPEGWSHIYG